MNRIAARVARRPDEPRRLRLTRNGVLSVGDAWVVDLRHYLSPAGALADKPSRARLLAEYFASIVVDATTNIDDPPKVRCRRRAGHRRCNGVVMSYPTADEHGSIYWYCPVCNDNGLIRGWQNTLWDGFADAPGAGS